MDHSVDSPSAERRHSSDVADSNARPDQPAGPDQPDREEIEALRSVVEGTAQGTGDEFFRLLTKHLASVIRVSYAFVAEFADTRTRARTLAFWGKGAILDNIEFDLAGTPCREVLEGVVCHHPRGVSRKFADDQALVDWGIESYLGVPLRNGAGEILGHLAVFDEKPMPEEPRKMLLFRVFAARAAAELERLRVERELRASEERFRDLYDEAPIAYVKEDLETRFHSANRAALRILGIRADEVAGTVGKSFIPDTPEAQQRVKDAFASVGRGTDTSGVVLELRRKDNGQPIWIQWWSKPEPGGKYTRTMFVDITDRVLAERERARLAAQNLYLQEEIKSSHNFEEIIGQSPRILAVLENVERVAETDASVLITGETGTGKELIARAIHSRSLRKNKPMIKVNCAALPAGLVESELFGHEKGAFTGAIARRVGRFELAAGGTIFLDEVGEIPLEAQVKLLRVLQEREFERVGGATTLPADVRLIAATNRDPRKAISEKTFREDLFYRLNVFPLHLPPLRERKEDIPLLARFLLDKFARRIGKRVEAIDGESLRRLVDYAWPGNIRELENILERAVILAPGETLEIPAEFLHVVDSRKSKGVSDLATSDLATIEREHIRRTLEQTDWVIEGPKGAAQILGLHPNTLRSRLKKLGLTRSGDI